VKNFKEVNTLKAMPANGCGAKWRNGSNHAKIRGTGPRSNASAQARTVAQHKQGVSIVASEVGEGDAKRQEQQRLEHLLLGGGRTAKR
jgi:hypothetical protein